MKKYYESNVTNEKRWRYVYPELSDKDFGFTRIGGLGLGNMLFPYARAVLYARDQQLSMIWPTWRTIPIGTILRGEKDKRFYNNLFVNKYGAISGVKKYRLLLCGKDVVRFKGMQGEFLPLGGRKNAQYLKQHFCDILNPNCKEALDFNPDGGVCVHIRLGDFTRGTEEDLKSGKTNTSIPLSWYIRIIQQIRHKIGKDIPIWVFSDGTEEELKEVLELKQVYRVSFGTAIGDILAMSNAELFIASGSSFSRWVRFLGRMNTITYPGQLKQQLLETEEGTFEIEAEELSAEDLQRIEAIYDRD